MAPESWLGIVFSPGPIEHLPVAPLTEANADTLKRIGALAKALRQTPQSETLGKRSERASSKRQLWLLASLATAKSRW